MDKSILFQPFFPFQVQQEGTNLIYPGVSLFDFYAIHAPRVPADFNYVKPPNFPPHPGFFKNHFGKESDYKYKHYVLQYHADDEWVGEYEKEVPEDIRTQMEADIAAWNEKMDKYLINISAWQLSDKLEKQSQWAKAYATHMIAMREGVAKSRIWDLKPEDLDKLLKMLDSSANEIWSFPTPPFTEQDIINAINLGFYMGSDTDIYGNFITERDEYVAKLKKEREPKIFRLPEAIPSHTYYLCNPNVQGPAGIIAGPDEMTEDEANKRNIILHDHKEDNRWVILSPDDLKDA